MPGHSSTEFLLLESRGILLDHGTNDGIIYTNTGVKICRHDEVRFMCANHGWDKPSIDDAVYYGNHKVGTVAETYGENIGLVTSEYPFSNQFLDVDVQAKGFLHYSLIPFGQFVVIDSAYASHQRMRLFGLHTGKKRPPAITMAHSLNSNVDQRIFSAQSAVINREPVEYAEQ